MFEWAEKGLRKAKLGIGVRWAKEGWQAGKRGDGICAFIWVLFDVLYVFHSIYFPLPCSSLDMLYLHVSVS